jgi:hypothetical protein
MNVSPDEPRNTKAAAPTGADVVSDLHCVHCGYDLRGQPRTGVCPECGVNVKWSRIGALWQADPSWLRKLRLGLRLLIGMLALALVYAVTLAEEFQSARKFLVPMLLGVPMLGLAGMWLFTVRNSATLGRSEPGALRQTVRWASVVAWALATSLGLAGSQGILAWNGGILAVAGLLAVCLLILLVVFYLYLIALLDCLEWRQHSRVGLGLSLVAIALVVINVVTALALHESSETVCLFGMLLIFGPSALVFLLIDCIKAERRLTECLKTARDETET